MNEPKDATPKFTYTMVWLTTGLVVLADQLSKFWALAYLTHAFDVLGGPQTASNNDSWNFLWQKHPIHRPAIAVLDNFWHFRYVENPGAAWGFMANWTSVLRTPMFLVISLLAMGFVIAYLKRSQLTQLLLRLGLALVLGGAIGNFLDRLRLGYVIDFIDWHWYTAATWPTFNVADAAISVGVGLLLLDSLLHKSASETQRKHFITH